MYILYVLIVICIFFCLYKKPRIKESYCDPKRYWFMFSNINTFCINLDSAIDRKNRMFHRFQFFDLEVTRWKASTPSNLIDSFRFPNRVENACSQSHILIWRYFLTTSLPYIFIMEDDVYFDKRWKYKLNNFRKDIEDSQWDCILLNKPVEKTKLNEWYLCHNKFLSGGYLLSRQGASKLLTHFHGKFEDSDHMLVWLQESHHTYTYDPPLMIQENLDTHLQHDIKSQYNITTSALKKIHYDIANYL